MSERYSLIPIEELKTRRLALGLSLIDLAGLTGMDSSTLHSVETGKRTPTKDTYHRMTAVLMEAEGKELSGPLQKYLLPKVRRAVVTHRRERALLRNLLSRGTGIPGCRLCVFAQVLGESSCPDYHAGNINCPQAETLFRRVFEDCVEDKPSELIADKYAYERIAALVVQIRFAERMLEILGWERPDTSDKAGQKAKWWLEQHDRWVNALGQWFDRCGFSRVKRDALRRYRGADLAMAFAQQTIDSTAREVE